MGDVVTTRDAREEDWSALWLLLQGMGVSDNEAVVKARFESMTRRNDWLIVLGELDGAAVGYAAVQDYGEHLRGGRRGHVGRLHDIFVTSDARQRGVGTALMAAVVNWAEQRVGYLQWQAHETQAAPFYERLGYRGDSCPQPDYPEFEIAFA